MHLFVYGTLKRGQTRQRHLSGQRFVGVAQTRPLYRLYRVGDFPGLVHSPDGRSIAGELWEVDEPCVQSLDRVEGCDIGLYRRQAVELVPPHDTLDAFTYIYLHSVDGLPDCGSCWQAAELL